MSITRLVGRYEFVGLVGKGGFGVVEEYNDLLTNELVAIKTIPARFVNQESKRLVREIDTMSFLHDAHPHVIAFFSMFVTPCTDSGTHSVGEDGLERGGSVVSGDTPENLNVEGPGYANISRGAALIKHHGELEAIAAKLQGTNEFNLHIVMPLMKGDLLYFIKHTSPTSSKLALTDEFIEQVAVVFAFQICFGLDYLHKCNIVHRDMKPENILVSLHNTNPYESKALIADLGLARDAQASDTFYVCTRYYRPPEIITNVSRGETSIDVWSLGCILFEMVTGRPLFTVNSALNEHGVWEGHRASTQLEAILNIIGTPHHDEIKRFMPVGNPQSYLLRSVQRPSQLREMMKNNWRMRTTPDRQENWMDLISSCLAFFPEQRPTCEDLCRHQLFRDFNVLYGENVKQHPAKTYQPTQVGTLMAENKQIVLRLVRRALQQSLSFVEEGTTDETTWEEEEEEELEEVLYPCSLGPLWPKEESLEELSDANSGSVYSAMPGGNISSMVDEKGEDVHPPCHNVNDLEFLAQCDTGNKNDSIAKVLKDLQDHTHEPTKSEKLRRLLNHLVSNQ